MKTFFLILLITMTFSTCNEPGIDDYKSMKNKELASGRKVDSIFFGIYFGMTSKQFYTHCWELNKKGIFTDGESNTAVLHKLNNNELKYPASMNFYPAFYQNKLYKMPVTFRYNGWAPWNKSLVSDSLQSDVLNMYQKWYKEGNPFIKIHDEKKGSIYVKVDGNRRITIGRYDDMNVKVDYTDLLVEENQMKK